MHAGNHMAGNDTGEKKELDPHTHLAEALNFDYFASIAPLVCIDSVNFSML
jgi:hypothetical protein